MEVWQRGPAIESTGLVRAGGATTLRVGEGFQVLELASVAATLRELVERAQAARAILLLDRGGDAAPLLVEVRPGGVAEVTEGESSRVLDASVIDEAPPLPLPELRGFAPMELDVSAGSLTGPLGALDHLGRAVRDTATLFPGRSVLTVGFATTDAELPLFLAAREGEPMVMALGDAQYELPEGFPAG